MKSKIFLIFFLLFTILLYPQSDLKILSSGRDAIIIEYTPNYSDTAIHYIDDQAFIKINLDNGFVDDNVEWGLPSIPLRSIILGVPSEYGNTIQIINSSFKEISGKVVPKPKLIRDGDKNINSFKYEISPEYNNYESSEDLIVFGDFGILRGIPTQSFKILPVKFNPEQNKIRLYTKIRFQINYSFSQNISNNPPDNFLKNVLINYGVARLWSKNTQEKRLAKSITNSVLAEGRWVRFEAPAEGIYKISHSMLSAFGIDPASVDPRTIKIYNNGGKVLSENPLAPHPSDLIENAVMVLGEEDGMFNENDYILFYGRGISFWDNDTSTNTIKRFFHPYSKENFYWITSGGNPGKRIAEKPSLNQEDKYVQTSTIAFASWEEDKINIGKTGRVYLGDDFSQAVTSRTYTNKLDGRLAAFPIKYNFRFVNASEESIGLELQENSVPIFSQNLIGYGSLGSNDDYELGVQHIKTSILNGELLENRSLLKFNFTPAAVTSAGFLDYFEIQYEKELKAFNDYLLFFAKDTNYVTEYNLSGFSSTNIKVFDITDHADLKIISNYIMLSGGECRFQSAEFPGKRSKYLAIGNDNFNTPINPVEIVNQNLHGISEGAEFIIITYKDFRDQAIRLKEHRENNSIIKISSVVVDIDQVFNEFSGGLRDVSGIRNFIKYAYDNWTIKPEYILLFGDGTYDYKNLEGADNNFIPTYQIPLFKEVGSVGYSVLHFLDSNPMDDYFVMVDGFDSIIDLTIGRININNQSEAVTAVDKIIYYEMDMARGTWNNLITLVADDGLTTEGNDGPMHTGQSETLANSKIPSSFNLNKIYLPAYPTVLTGLGRTKPGVYRDIINAINQGTLILNYIGHGSPELWAHERIFEKSTTVPQLVNDKYPFLTAATCDFGYFDLPSVQSATEVMISKPNSGIIGAFTASRPVYSGPNAALSYAFFSNLLNSSRDISNLPITVGEAYFKTKIVFRNNNDQKFLLFGDPTLRLAIPQYEASIDSINNFSTMGSIQLKALSKTTVEGSILHPDNTSWDDFNGEGILTVFDSERSLTIVEKIDTNRTNNYNVTFPGGTIFNGRISINNGKFSSDFVVPKDISYDNKNGKVLIYFFNNEVDGIGFTDNVIIGGTDSTAVNDGAGPNIEIYFDDASSAGSYLANPNSTLIIKLADETGINTTGTGVGHTLEGILNDKENDPIDFTNYFTGDLDAGGKSGEVNYRFNGIEQGEYKLQVKAWDVYNNFSTEYAYFSVVSGDDLVIRDVVNYPNPFTSNTTFTFQQNLNKILDLKINVYTVAGRLIKKIERNSINDKFVKIGWDGRDEDGNLLANGTYLYKIIVKTIDGEFNKSVLGKLAVIR